MNTEELASYAAIIEAVVVIVSLIFMAMQMRQNTLATKGQAGQEQTNSYNTVLNTIINESVIWAKGVNDFDDLNDDQKDEHKHPFTQNKNEYKISSFFFIFMYSPHHS